MIQALITNHEDHGLDLDVFNTEAEALFAVREMIRVELTRSSTEPPADLEERDADSLLDLIGDKNLSIEFCITPLFGPSQHLQSACSGMTHTFPATQLTLI